MEMLAGNSSEHGDGEEEECFFSKHQWLFAKFLLTSVISTCVALLGICGNITTAAVLTRPMMRTPNNLYLTVLAIFDTLVLILALMLYSTEYIQEYFDSVNLYVLWMDSTPYLYSLSNFAQTGSVYITVAVTFERYLAVVHPKLGQRHCTKPRASVAILGVICFAAVFNASKFFEVEVIVHDNCTGFASRSLGPSELLMDSMYSTLYTLWLSQFIMVFFPFGVLLTINTAIVWNFKKSLKKLDREIVDLDRGILKEQSRDATRVLVTIVAVFLICNSWGFVITLLESIYGGRELSQWAPKFYAFSREAINFLAIVNSSINFLVCIAFSDDFRCELMILYGCRRRRRRKSLGDTVERRRKAFSDGRPKIFAKFPRPSRDFGAFGCQNLKRMRYVDRLNSGETLANYNGGSFSTGESSNSLKVPSFSALIEAAQMLVNGSVLKTGQDKDSLYRRSHESPIKEMEEYLKQNKSPSSEHVSNIYTNGSVRDEAGLDQPFLYKNKFLSDFEMDWETMI